MARRKLSRRTSASSRAISAFSTRAQARFKNVGWAKALLRRAHHFSHSKSLLGGHASLCPPYSSLRQDVFPVLDRQKNARAIVEAVAVFFAEVVDALTGRNIPLGEQGLADSLAEFRRTGFCRLQRNRD